MEADKVERAIKFAGFGSSFSGIKGEAELRPPEGKSISDDFVGATFGGKWKFPKVGSDVMLTVDYELAPGRCFASISKLPGRAPVRANVIAT